MTDVLYLNTKVLTGSKTVLQHLQKHGLYAQAKKCEWHRDSVEFLGYIMSSKGLTMANDKICTILDWPEPQKVKDIQSFLEFANFYRRFIHNYLEITVPLTRLTWKGLTWDFNEDCHMAFRTLKEAFTKAPVLAHCNILHFYQGSHLSL